MMNGVNVLSQTKKGSKAVFDNEYYVALGPHHQ